MKDPLREYDRQFWRAAAVWFAAAAIGAALACWAAAVESRAAELVPVPYFRSDTSDTSDRLPRDGLREAQGYGYCQPIQRPQQQQIVQGPPGPPGPPGQVSQEQLDACVNETYRRLYTPLYAALAKDLPAAIRVPNVEPVYQRLDAAEAQQKALAAGVAAIRVPDLQPIRTDLQALDQRTQDLAGRQGQKFAAIDAAIVALQAAPTWAPYLAGGGPIGGGLAIGLTALGWYLRRRGPRVQKPEPDCPASPGPTCQTGPTGPTCQTSCDELAQLKGRVSAVHQVCEANHRDVSGRLQVLARTVEEIRQSRPAASVPATIVPEPAAADPIIVRETTVQPSTYVEVEKDPRRLVALNKAMDEYVRRHPGGRQTVETIQAFADQFESGLKK